MATSPVTTTTTLEVRDDDLSTSSYDDDDVDASETLGSEDTDDLSDTALDIEALTGVKRQREDDGGSQAPAADDDQESTRLLREAIAENRARQRTAMLKKLKSGNEGMECALMMQLYLDDDVL